MKALDVMKKTELVNRIIDLLRQYEYKEGYHYDPTEEAIGKMVDVWYKNKYPLIELLERNPHYDGDFKIVLSSEMYRTTNVREAMDFMAWVADSIPTYRPYEVGQEVQLVSEQPTDLSYLWFSPDMKSDLGQVRTIEDIDDYEDYVYIRSTEGRKRAWLYEWIVTPPKENKISMTHREKRAFLDLPVDQYITEETREKLNNIFPWLKAHRGAKLSKLINRICKECKLNEDPTYNTRFSRFADAINPLTIRRWTILSVNPIDYLTMSFGNSWASCHTIDKTNLRGTRGKHYSGCYSGGTLSYMLDPSSMVFYTVDGSYNGTHYELESKVHRQMFHYGEEKLIQGRLYPLDQEDNEHKGDTECMQTYSQFREIVQRIIADATETPNFWTNKKGTVATYEFVSDTGSHYPDYRNYENVNISIPKGNENRNLIHIGHAGICPQCGGEHYESESILCEECFDYTVTYCDNCGNEMDSGAIYAEGHNYCCAECAEAAGYVLCSDGCWRRGTNYDVMWDDYTQMYEYDSYGSCDDAVYAEDGTQYFNPENATAAGYVDIGDARWIRREDAIERGYVEGVFSWYIPDDETETGRPEKVVVTNPGSTYSSYRMWLEEHAPDYLPIWDEGNAPCYGDEGEVVGTGMHMNGVNKLVAVKIEGKVYIIGMEGVRYA